MLFTSTLAIAASLLSLTEALQLHKRSDGPARVAQLDIQRKRSEASGPARDRLRKRQNPLSVELDNLQTLYFADVSIGTPAQPFRLIIDTGSSDLWANSANANLCSTSPNPCSSSGTYNANSSSTYSYVNSAFLIRYADGSFAQGDYVTDTVTFGGVALQDLQLGVGYNSGSSQGILGIGYMTNEAAIATIGRTYVNLPEKLVRDGVTETNAYSLWLNDLDASTGSILFGGVDTEKYDGDLQTVPIIRESGVYQELVIGLSSVTAAGQSVFSDPIAVLLDSGASLSYLPDAYAQILYQIFGGQYSTSIGAAVVDCSLRNNAETVVFNFSGIDIAVPMNELVLVQSVTNGVETCVLGVSSAGDSTSVLGDTFLRSAYVVYDLENNQISLAQTTFNATSSNVLEITAGSSSVPNATPVPNPVTDLVVATGGARHGGSTPATSGAGVTAASGMLAGMVAAGAAVFGFVLLI